MKLAKLALPSLLAEIVYRFDQLKSEHFRRLSDAQLVAALESLSAANQLAQREAIGRLSKRGN